MKMSNEELIIKLKTKCRASKSKSGFSIGQNWTNGNSYIPHAVAYHGAYKRDTFVFESIQKLVWTSISTCPKFWTPVFEKWIKTENYKKLKILFEPIKKEINKSDDFTNAIKIATEVITNNLNLLPKEVIEELKELYEEHMSHFDAKNSN